ncbi:MAG: GGDEF domain-containing protein [Fusobacteriaceae bacterium]
MNKYCLVILISIVFYLAETFFWGFSEKTFFLIATKISLSCVVYFLIEKSLKKWDGIKIFLDGLIISLMLFYILWAFIYNSSTSYLLFNNFENSERLYFLFSLVIDFIMLFGLTIFYFFNRNYLKIKKNLIEILGFVLYFITDFSLLYCRLYRTYEYLIELKIGFLISLLLILVSAIIHKKIEESIESIEESEMYNSKNIVFNCLFVLLGITLFKMAPAAFLIILPIIMFRLAFSKYVMVSRFNLDLVENVGLDSLTKLFNRKKFIQEMNKVFKDSKKEGMIIILQINKFKYMNNVYGYVLGNRILVEMGKRVREVTNEGDLSARWNGDELILFFKNITEEREAYEKCEEILKLLKTPFKHKEEDIVCSINIGASLAPKNSSDLQELIKFADSCLIRSCREGENGIIIFQENIGLEKEYKKL